MLPVMCRGQFHQHPGTQMHQRHLFQNHCPVVWNNAVPFTATIILSIPLSPKLDRNHDACSFFPLIPQIFRNLQKRTCFDLKVGRIVWHTQMSRKILLQSLFKIGYQDTKISSTTDSTNTTKVLQSFGMIRWRYKVAYVLACGTHKWKANYNAPPVIAYLSKRNTATTNFTNGVGNARIKKLFRLRF